MPVRPQKKLAILQRRRQVADLYVQGLTQCEIAERLGMKQPTICDDLKKIRQEWRASAIRDFDLLRELELRKLDRLEREAWAAWERSQKPAQSADIQGEGAGPPTRKRIKNQYGDPRFLALINQCIFNRRALLGLDAGPLLKESPDDTVSLEERQTRIATLVATLCERERTAGTGTELVDVQSGPVRAGHEPE